MLFEFSATEKASSVAVGSADNGTGFTVMFTVPVAASPFKSVMVYSNESAPLKPAGAEYNTTSSEASFGVLLSDTLIKPPSTLAVLSLPFTKVNGCVAFKPSDP